MSKNKSIGIVAHLVHPDRIGGAEVYARNLINTIPTLAGDIEFTIFLAKGHDYRPPSSNVKLELSQVPVSHSYLRVVWEHAFLARILSRNRLDLIHFLGSTAPLGYRDRSVVTIHDSLRFQVPESTPWMLGKYYSWNQRSISKRQFDVINVSGYDSDVLRANLGISEEKQHVVPLGGVERYSNVPYHRDANDIYWIGYPYQHKRIPIVIEGFSRASKQLPTTSKLHLIGIGRKTQQKIQNLVFDSDVADRIIIHPLMNTNELKELMPSLAVLAFPSSYESFGIPVLEALSCGRSVACSNHPVFKELFEDHVHSTSDFSVEAFAMTIVDAFNEYRTGDKHNAHRAFAQKYDWKSCASKTLDVYQPTFAKRVAVTKDLKVSFVIPTLNQGSFIRRCIDQCLGQSLQNFEVIVQDGGSTDGTHQVLDSYGDKIDWHADDDDRGQSMPSTKRSRVRVGKLSLGLTRMTFMLENFFRLFMNTSPPTLTAML